MARTHRHVVGSPVTSMFSFTVQGTAAWTEGRPVTALVAEQEKLPGEVTEGGLPNPRTLEAMK